MPTEKLYCYVDETGQDTHGEVFIVSVVVVKKERDELLHLLERIEIESRKRAVKWRKAKREYKYAYLERVLNHAQFAGKIFYRVAEDTQAYRQVTLTTIGAVVWAAKSQPKYKASVFIDGLPRGEVRAVGTELRKRGIATEKVRGIRDESNALIRLADAVAGLIREATEEESVALRLRRLGERRGTLRAV